MAESRLRRHRRPQHEPDRDPPPHGRAVPGRRRAVHRPRRGERRVGRALATTRATRPAWTSGYSHELKFDPPSAGSQSGDGVTVEMSLGADGVRLARRLDLVGSDRRRDRQGRPERQRLRVSGRVLRRHRPALAVQRPRQVLRPEPRRLLLGRPDAPAADRREPAAAGRRRRRPPCSRPPCSPPTGEVLGAQVVSGSSRLLGPSGCAGRTVKATVKGRRIAKVTFLLDGKKVKVVKGAGSYSVRLLDARRRACTGSRRA